MSNPSDPDEDVSGEDADEDSPFDRQMDAIRNHRPTCGVWVPTRDASGRIVTCGPGDGEDEEKEENEEKPLF